MERARETSPCRRDTREEEDLFLSHAYNGCYVENCRSRET
jgi:hypothetical protein